MSHQESTCPLHQSGCWYFRVLGHVACCAVLLTASGCFEKSYSDRMKTTVDFYTHKDKLNKNLTPEWVGPGYRLRVPIGFELIPPPEPKQPDPNQPQAATDKAEELDDLRQPDFLGFRFPGLIAAWQKDVGVDTENGVVAKKARIYLLSNVAMFAVPPDAPDRIEPSKFHERVTHLLTADVMTPLKEDDWRGEDVPVGNFNLVQKVRYQAATLAPERLFEETKLTFKIYLHAENATQTVLLVVYPTETSSNEKLSERLTLTLETLRAPADPQQATSPAGGGNTKGGPAL